MFTLFRVRRFDVSVVGASSLRFLADIPDVDREDSTWVRDFCVSGSSSETNRAKPSANAVWLVRGAHAKSPCRSPFAAAVTRSVSPRRIRASGFAPLSEGRGVVNQTHAA